MERQQPQQGADYRGQVARTPHRERDEPMARTSLRLPASLWKGVKIRATELGMPAQDWVEDALREKLARSDDPAES